MFEKAAIFLCKGADVTQLVRQDCAQVDTVMRYKITDYLLGPQSPGVQPVIQERSNADQSGSGGAGNKSTVNDTLH